MPLFDEAVAVASASWLKLDYGTNDGVNYDLDRFRGDLFGGITSMVVALPIALGFGVASGMGAAAGLYGAIAVGFFAAVFGGTRSQISGPTAPMTVAMVVILTSHTTNLAEAMAVVVMAGLLQVILGLSKIGRFLVYTPHVVVSGFMSGIGIIIMLMQALPFLGAPAVSGGVMGVVRTLPEAVTNIDISAFVIATVTLAVAVLWPRRLARIAPSALAALIAGTVLGVVWLNGAPVIGEVPTGLPDLQLSLPSAGFLLGTLEPALILALLGSVDSLITSLIADSLTSSRHNPDRELIGQGIGNMVAGLVGALPGSGATVNTVTNIRAGGRTPVSGAMCAVLLLALVLGLGRYVEPIPLAALAGVLMKIGWDIVDWRLFTLMHRIPRAYMIIMLATLTLTVFVDLLTAVAIGLIAAGMAHARQLERLELDSVISAPLLDRTFFTHLEEDEDPFLARIGLVALRGSFTVASSHKLVEVIGKDIMDHEVVIFDFTDATYIDDSASMMLERLMGVADETQTEIIVMGISGNVANTLRALGILKDVPKDHIVDTLDDARHIARKLLRLDGSPR